MLKVFKLVIFFIAVGTSVKSSAGPSSIIELSASEHRPGTAFVVNKSERKLQVWTVEEENLKMISMTDVDIGKGQGIKLKRGDLKTPEGVYFLVSKKTPPEIPVSVYGDLAFTTNYPNFFDEMEGKTGDGIWLHAVPDTVSLMRGSRGCVVVNNKAIKELEPYIKLKHTSLIISDSERNISEEERTQLRDRVKKFTDSWRASWEMQDMQKFLGFYSDKFKGYGMSFSQWSKYKQKLALRNKNTKIAQKDFNILRFKNQFVVLFSQNFQSDKFNDEGDKILYLSDDGDQLKIISEDFLKERLDLTIL